MRTRWPLRSDAGLCGLCACPDGATPKDILETIHARSTVAEAVMEAAGNVFGRGIYTPK